MYSLVSKLVLRQAYSRKCILSKQFTSFIHTRGLCSQLKGTSSSKKSEYPQNPEEWRTIYMFPLIPAARLLNRFKLYQTAFTTALLPLSIGLYSYNVVDFDAIAVSSGAAVFTCLTLYVATSFFKRLIGFVFVSNDEKYVKIAHLTFWGRREDIVVPVEDIIPLTEGKCYPNDAFVKLYRNSSDEPLYITLRFGVFVDRKSFQDIFGDFEVLGFKQ